jgi:hypothetical protein
MKNLLICWCIIPIVVYIFIILKIKICPSFKRFFDLIAVVLSTLDIFFIQKSLKMHPEYDSDFVRETEKEKYYASLSPDELQKVKSVERKEEAKNFVKKLFLIGGGNKVDSYKIVRLFIVLMLLVALKRLLL